MRSVLRLLLMTALAAEAFAQSPTGWIDQQTIRAAYFYGRGGLDKAALMKNKGINTMILKCKVKDALPWAKEAKRLGMRCFFACNFSVDAKKLGLRQAVLADGFVERYVCPLDERFWRDHFAKPIMAAVGYSTQPDMEVTGLWIDFELYHELRSRYYTTTACYCDQCFHDFTRARTDETPAVEPAKRMEWLRERGLFEQYHPHLQKRVEALASELGERVHGVNPGFLLGFYPTPKNWSLIGVARGLSTKDKPIIIWATDTYGGGGPKRVPSDWRESFEGQGIHARYCAGMLLRCYSATNLAANLYYASQKCDGYWLFTTYTLWTAPEKRGKLYYLAAGTPDEYWSAIQTANAAIEQRLRLGEEYECPLIYRPESTHYVRPGVALALDTSSLTAPSVATEAKLSPGEPRREHQLIFFASQGQNVNIVLAHRKVGAYVTGLSYTVFAPDDQILAEGKIDRAKTDTIAFKAESGGFYRLGVNPGACSFSVIRANVPVAVIAKPKLAMIRKAGPLYFHVPKGVKQFKLLLKGGGGRETAKLAVSGPSGVEAAAVSLTRSRISAELEVKTDGKDDAVWSFTVSRSHDGILEDWSLTLDKQLPPLVSFAKEHVFRLRP